MAEPEVDLAIAVTLSKEDNEKFLKALKSAPTRSFEPSEHCYMEKPFATFSDPLVGLEHLVEIPCLKPKYEPAYYCRLCCLKAAAHAVIAHVLSHKHRRAHLSTFKHTSTEMKTLLSGPKENLPRAAALFESINGRRKVLRTFTEAFSHRILNSRVRSNEQSAEDTYGYPEPRPASSLPGPSRPAAKKKPAPLFAPKKPAPLFEPPWSNPPSRSAKSTQDDDEVEFLFSVKANDVPAKAKTIHAKAKNVSATERDGRERSGFTPKDGRGPLSLIPRSRERFGGLGPSRPIRPSRERNRSRSRSPARRSRERERRRSSRSRSRERVRRGSPPPASRSRDLRPAAIPMDVAAPALILAGLQGKMPPATIDKQDWANACRYFMQKLESLDTAVNSKLRNMYGDDYSSRNDSSADLPRTSPQTSPVPGLSLHFRSDSPEILSGPSASGVNAAGGQPMTKAQKRRMRRLKNEAALAIMEPNFVPRSAKRAAAKGPTVASTSMVAIMAKSLSDALIGSIAGGSSADGRLAPSPPVPSKEYFAEKILGLPKAVPALSSEKSVPSKASLRRSPDPPVPERSLDKTVEELVHAPEVAALADLLGYLHESSAEQDSAVPFGPISSLTGGAPGPSFTGLRVATGSGFSNCDMGLPVELPVVDLEALYHPTPPANVFEVPTTSDKADVLMQMWMEERQRAEEQDELIDLLTAKIQETSSSSRRFY